MSHSNRRATHCTPLPEPFTDTLPSPNNNDIKNR